MDIEQGRRNEVREQIEFIGKLAEGKIFKGEKFLNEPERVWLRGLVERSGVELDGLQGDADLSGQAEVVVRKLGPARAVDLVREVVVEMLDVYGGGVYGKGNKVSENAKEEVGKFVDSYLGGQMIKPEFVFDPKKFEGDGGAGSNWKMNTVYRIEAVMSVTNKLLWVLAGEGQEEGERRQGTKGILKHLRERVMRGGERAGDVVTAEERFEKDKVVRHLPKGGLSMILERLTEAR